MTMIRVIKIRDDHSYTCKIFEPGFYTCDVTNEIAWFKLYEKGKKHYDHHSSIRPTDDVYEVLFMSVDKSEISKLIDPIFEGKDCTIVTYRNQTTVYDGIYGALSEIVLVYTGVIDDRPDIEDTAVKKVERAQLSIHMDDWFKEQYGDLLRDRLLNGEIEKE